MPGLLYLLCVCVVLNSRVEVDRSKKERIKTSNCQNQAKSHGAVGELQERGGENCLGSSFHIRQTHFYQISQKTGRD